jgi:hypothetical protein
MSRYVGDGILLCVVVIAALASAVTVRVYGDRHRDVHPVHQVCEGTPMPDDTPLRLVWQRRDADGFTWVSDDLCGYYVRAGTDVEVIERP